MQEPRNWPILTIIFVALSTLSCGKSESSNQQHRQANTPAGKVGQVAYEAAKESGKVAKAAAKEVSKAAHQAHEGWKEAEQKDKAKQ